MQIGTLLSDVSTTAATASVAGVSTTPVEPRAENNLSNLASPDMDPQRGALNGQETLASHLSAGTLSEQAAERVLEILTHIPLTEVFSPTSALVSAAILGVLGAPEAAASQPGIPAKAAASDAAASSVPGFQTMLSYLMNEQTLERLGIAAAYRTLTSLVADVSSYLSAKRAVEREPPHKKSFASENVLSSSDISFGVTSPILVTHDFVWLKATDLLKAITTSPEKDIIHEAMRQFVEALEREKRESQREAKKEREKEDRLLEMAKALVRAIDGLNGKENASRQTILANLAGPFPNIEQAIRTAQEGERREEAEEANAAARQELSFRQQTQRNQNLDAFK